MNVKLKAIIEAEQTTRIALDNCIMEKGQGVVFLLAPNQIYNGKHLAIQDNTLVDSDGKKYTTLKSVCEFYES